MVRGITKKEVMAIVARVNDLKEELNSVIDQMQEYYDARSESWQYGEGGAAYEERIGEVELSVGYLEEVEETFTNWYEE